MYKSDQLTNVTQLHEEAKKTQTNNNTILYYYYYIILPQIPTLSTKKKGGMYLSDAIPCILRSQLMEILLPKLPQALWSDAKRVKMAENHRKAAKKHAKKTG